MFANIPERTEGKLDLSGETAAVFVSKKGNISIPYKTVESLEYRQKAGCRVGVAVAVSPVALFSKKRKHYLTVAFSDEQGARQGAVFEAAKGRVHSVVKTLQARSGKSGEFEPDEAKKHFEKEAK